MDRLSLWMSSLAVAEKAFQQPHADRACYLLRHGSMKVGVYAPRGCDDQRPHLQDELYIVARGSAVFILGGARRSVAADDVFFVEAGADHRFEEISDDFMVWVVFWGPRDGEPLRLSV